ncbi:MAG: hypothetical protein NC822_02910 [Candidatus Omnitrophica bacterium]|nr:hypothetical protein [Candidatus Omnitrophota bacterium]MCM8827377.1 hypothetical protein [Candidatus Omnitrophota bacterium]
MDREELIKEFLNNFKISLTNACIYFDEHPYFQSSVKNFKDIIEELFHIFNPIILGITPKSILIGEEQLDKESTHIELAAYLHYRKIKKITIRQGLTLEELISFLSVVSLPVKDIFVKGGLGKIFLDRSLVNIEIEELDYSELLEVEYGEEGKDVWKCFIEGIYNKKINSGELNIFIDNFDRIISKFNLKDIINDRILLDKLIGVLRYIKETGDERFKNCSSSFTKFIIKENKFLKEDIPIEVIDFIKDIDPIILCDVLWDINFDKRDFNPLTFNLFSKILDIEKNREIAKQLKKRVGNSKFIFDRSAKEKIKELFHCLEENPVTNVYKDTLLEVINAIENRGRGEIDREELAYNYRYMLLNILSLISDKLYVEDIVKRIMDDWDSIMEKKDAKFIKCFWQVLREKIKEEKNDEMLTLYKDSEEKAKIFLEKIILSGKDNLDEDEFNCFLENIEKSTFDENFYIENILNNWENSSSKKRILKLFFKLFPQKKELLFIFLKRHFFSTVDGIKKAIELGKDIDGIEGLNFLKKLFFYIDNTMLRIEIIKNMGKLSLIDTDFLTKILDSHNIFLKREALKVLKKGNKELQELVGKKLVGSYNLFGIRRGVFLDNLRIIEEENFKPAKRSLQNLSKKYFFWWEKGIKKEILRVLAKL